MNRRYFGDSLSKYELCWVSDRNDLLNSFNRCVMVFNGIVHLFFIFATQYLLMKNIIQLMDFFFVWLFHVSHDKDLWVRMYTHCELLMVLLHSVMSLMNSHKCKFIEKSWAHELCAVDCRVCSIAHSHTSYCEVHSSGFLIAVLVGVSSSGGLIYYILHRSFFSNNNNSYWLTVHEFVASIYVKSRMQRMWIAFCAGFVINDLSS